MYIEKLKSYKKAGNFLKRSDSMSLLSTSILLYILGLFIFFLLYIHNATLYTKEQIPFFITVKDSVKESEIFKLQQKLKNSQYVTQGSVLFVTGEEAMNKLTDKNLTKEDLMLFGKNLLPNSIEFKINVIHKKESESFLEDLKKNNVVDEIVHNDFITEPFHDNISLIFIIIFLLVLFFIFVAYILVKNALKISLNENKNIISLLEMTGSSKEFIFKPYVRNYTMKAVISGILSVSALAISLYFIHLRLTDFWLFLDPMSISITLFSLFLITVLTYRCVVYFSLKSIK